MFQNSLKSELIEKKIKIMFCLKEKRGPGVYCKYIDI